MIGRVSKQGHRIKVSAADVTDQVRSIVESLDGHVFKFKSGMYLSFDSKVKASRARNAILALRDQEGIEAADD